MKGFENDIISILNNLADTMDINLIAWCVLSDHIHLLLEPKENNLSEYLKRFKLKVAYQIRKDKNLYKMKVWQNRFWDHIIRDQKDLNVHLDYIHYNPVKHGYKNSSFEYTFSSLNKHKDKYQDDWGLNRKMIFEGDFGE